MEKLSLTIEEAVAEMVNMDYIPAGLTLLEMTSAFQEEAEVEYENALIDRLPEDQLVTLKTRMDSCNARHTLAQLLFESLQYEVDHPENSMIVFAKDSSSHRRLTRMSVWEWAGDRYGISISMGTKDSNKLDEKLEAVRWEDVIIKIWKDHNIGYSINNGGFKRSHFRKIGFMGQIKKEPNHLGMILTGLSQKKIFPGGKLVASEKTAISKLRKVLFKWTDLPDDPFLPYNEHDGWKPRFKLIYDVRNADERAKEKAFHVPLDENRNAYDNDD